MAKELILNKGYYTLVDDDDYYRLIDYIWYCNCVTGAVRRNTKYLPEGSQGIMSRFIMGVTDPGIIVDHINGNSLDNRRCNLRLTTRGGNNVNTKLRIDNTTGYKGVFYYKKFKKYGAKVQLNGTPIIVGYYSNPIDAAMAYDRKAIELFGDMANTNIINKKERGHWTMFYKPEYVDVKNRLKYLPERYYRYENTETGERYKSVPAVKKGLGLTVHISTVERMLKRGELPHIKAVNTRECKNPANLTTEQG